MSATVGHSVDEQRVLALRAANKVRIGRAAVKADIRGGGLSIFDVLASPPACVASMTLFDLLMAMPRVGRVKALRWCNTARISPERTVGMLGQRRREVLVSVMRGGRLEAGR